MLITLQAAMDATVDGIDGTIGSLRDLIFTQTSWEIRYLSVRTGQLLGLRRILLPPQAVDHRDWANGAIAVQATREQIGSSPEFKGDLLSRREEQQLMMHFGWRPYWETTIPLVAEGPPELWSAKELIGYDVEARDGDVGYVEDIIFDDQAWTIRYLVVDIGSWLSGRRILAAPEWTREIDWGSRDLRLSLTKSEIEHGPEFDPSAPVNREYEDRLYDYYGRPKYWEAAGTHR